MTSSRQARPGVLRQVAKVPDQEDSMRFYEKNVIAALRNTLESYAESPLEASINVGFVKAV